MLLFFLPSMETFLIVLILFALVALLFFAYTKFEELKSLQTGDQSQKLLLDVVQNLQREVREGGDKNRLELQQRLDKTLEQLVQQMTSSQKSVDFKLAENRKSIEERLDNAAKVITSVTQELGKMQELSKHVSSLTDIFRNAKKRGGLGDEGLAEMLSEVLSNEQYSLQARIGDSEIVDAIIKTKNGIIPIDSKFPIDNYRLVVAAKTEEAEAEALKDFRRDVKKHISDISKKYIRPDQGTVDFAIMYIPA